MKKIRNRRPCDIVFDSTGLKCMKKGEWKVRQHGASKRRVWRKLHLGIDPGSKEILVAELTKNGVGSGDGQIGKKLMKKVTKNAKRIFGDGAYDGTDFRKEVESYGAEPIIPPPRDAVIYPDITDSAIKKRNDALSEINGLGGGDAARKLWKILKT